MAEHAVVVYCAWRIVRELWRKKNVATVLSGPQINDAVASTVRKLLEPVERELLGDGDPEAVAVVPAAGWGHAAVVDRLEALRPRHDVQKWGGVYHAPSSAVCATQARAFEVFNCTNLLYPGTFKSARKLEAELVAMTVDLVGGGKAPGGLAEKRDFPAPDACGVLTSGGTESIFTAMLAYREAAASVASPRVVAGVTAHPALKKACKVLNLELVVVPVGNDMRMDVATVRAALTASTVAIYASAPTFSHGVIDPIVALGKLAREQGLGLHVDNCLGGILLSMRDDAPPFDLRVDGVTSLSVDLHKYGNASKGTSVVVFRDPNLRRAAYLPSADGCEGLYVTPTLAGSRSGAMAAQAWATLVHIGRDGYAASADNVVAATRRLVDIIKHDFRGDLDVLVVPDAATVPIVAAYPAKLSIYSVADAMERRGWNVFTGQNPPIMSFCLAEFHATPGVLDAWAAALRAAVDDVKASPKDELLHGNAAIYNAKATAPDDVIDAIMRGYVDLTLATRPLRRRRSLRATRF